ncbi:hypothetical protein C8J57DRAFT_1634386 [Mycena rebaudengoi]|nr:hypothetical protein C8J57DRAFT_1634386 [Mycena rebaudengoi]
MSLVALRFYTWTKPVRFRIAVVRRNENWMHRVSGCLLPNATFIQLLVLDMPFRVGWNRSNIPEEELVLIGGLLEASNRVRHLAVTWNIWETLERECCSLRLESLYLVWDGAFNIDVPSLCLLQHPSTLEDLTVYAPAELDDPTPFRSWGERHLPKTTQCINLAYVTYAADRMPYPHVCYVHLKGSMLVLVGRTEPYEDEKSWIERSREIYPNYSTVKCVRYSSQVLVEWVAKMEGQESLLYHTTQ